MAGGGGVLTDRRGKSRAGGACRCDHRPDRARSDRTATWIPISLRRSQNIEWQNLTDCHEMYCAGHMTEAGVAYYQATGKTKLLDICCKLCDHIDRRFGRDAGKVTGIPGHEEIELALMRLYRGNQGREIPEAGGIFYR